MNGRPWTEKNKAALRAAYAKGGYKACKARFPKRGKWSLYHMLSRLRLCRSRRWTPKEIEHLYTYWGTQSLRSLCRILRRTRVAICGKARQLGLSLGCPQGFEYLTAAATRAGYNTRQLRQILAWAEVKIKDAYVAIPGQRRQHIVDPIDVEDAVAAWLQTETLNAACKRLGIDDRTLVSRLKQAGIVPKKTDPDNRCAHYRVKSKDIDEAMRLWRDSETIAAGAKRVGTTPWLLRRYLERAGVDLQRIDPERHGSHFRVPSKEIDRVMRKIRE